MPPLAFFFTPQPSSTFAYNHYTMSEVEVKARLLAWGNSYGIRLSRDDVQRFGLKPDQEIRIKLEVSREAIGVSDLPSFDLGGAADRHDDVFARSVEERKRTRRR